METASDRGFYQLPRLTGWSVRDVLDLLTAESKTSSNQVHYTPDGNHENESHDGVDSQVLSLLFFLLGVVDKELEHSPHEHQQRDTENERYKRVVDKGGDLTDESIDLSELS